MSVFKQGFTLIELLVVIAIMAGLTAVLLPQMDKFNQRKALDQAALDLQSALRFAQNNAASGVNCKSAVGTRNWYLKFINPQNYVIEATCSDATVDSGLPTPTPPLESKKDYILPAGIKFSQIAMIDGLGMCPTTLDTNNPSNARNFRVLFGNVSAEVQFEYDNGCSSSNYQKMKVVLQMTADTSREKNVIVEKGGAIYIESN